MHAIFTLKLLFATFRTSPDSPKLATKVTGKEIDYLTEKRDVSYLYRIELHKFMGSPISMPLGEISQNTVITLHIHIPFLP